MLTATLNFVTVLSWVLVLWRLASAWHDAQRRALWGIIATLALALTFKLPAVKDGITHGTGIVDLAVLIKHWMIILMIVPTFAYVAAIYGRSDDGTEPIVRSERINIDRWARIIVPVSALVASLAMALIFILAIPRPHPTEHFIPEHAGELAASAYIGIFYVFLGGSCILAFSLFATAARRAPSGTLRTALVLLSCAYGLGIVYTLHRSAFVLASLIGVGFPGGVDGTETITEAEQLGMMVLFLVGVTVGATKTASDRVCTWNRLARLWPLWHDLATALPQVLLTGRATGRVGDRLKVTLLPVRLESRIAEIRDAVLTLRHYVTDAAHADAASSAAADGHTGRTAAIVTEALWIQQALNAYAAGSPPQPAVEFTTGAGADDLEWLLEVAAAYSALPPLGERPLQPVR